MSLSLRALSLRLLACACALGALAACTPDGDDASPAEVTYRIGEPIQDSSYAAIVTSDFGNDTLTTDAFVQQVNRYMMRFPQLQGDPSQLRELQRLIVTEFIRDHLIRGEATRLGTPVDTAVVSEQFAQFRAQFPDEAAFLSFQEQEGVTTDSLRQLIAEGLQRQQVIDTMIAAAATPSAEEIEAYRTEQAEQVRAQHILFLVDSEAPDATRDSVRTLAESILDSAQAGDADFADLARRYSEDPGSASFGGDLNYFGRGQMVPPFEEATFALADSGDVAPELIETVYGYHIIRLTGRRTAPLMPEAQAEQTLLQERQREALESSFTRLREEADLSVRLNDAIVDADLNEAGEI